MAEFLLFRAFHNFNHENRVREVDTPAGPAAVRLESLVAPGSRGKNLPTNGTFTN